MDNRPRLNAVFCHPEYSMARMAHSFEMAAPGLRRSYFHISGGARCFILSGGAGGA